MSGQRDVRRVAPAFMSFDECIRLGVEDANRLIRRHRIRTVTAWVMVPLSLALLAGGGLWALEVSARRAEALRSCNQTVESLSERYSYALTLHGRVRNMFEQGNTAYDLDALAAAYDIAPPVLPTVDCEADPAMKGADADSAASDLDGYVSWLEDLLSVE